MTNRLGRSDDLGYTMQFRLIHDADGLNQTSAEHVGSHVLWEYKEVFQQHAETLSNQLQCIKTGKVHPTLKPGHVAWINLYAVGKLLLRQSRLLAQLLNPPPDSLFGVHALAFRVDRAISHREAAVNRGREMQKLLKTRRKTFHLSNVADTIAVMRRVNAKKEVSCAKFFAHHPLQEATILKTIINKIYEGEM